MKSSIIKKGEFDINALKKSRAANKAKIDLVAGIREISPEIEKLLVGETCVIEGVEAANIRKVVMQVTAKLSHLTAKGGDWAGKAFQTASNADEGKVYVQRGPNVKPENLVERKKGGGGGRKKKTETVAPAAAAEASPPAATAPTAAVVEHA